MHKREQQAHQVGVQVLERALAGHEGLEAGEGNMARCQFGLYLGCPTARRQATSTWQTADRQLARPQNPI